MSQFVELGPDAKVKINSTPYAVVEGRYRIVGDTPDTTDTESPNLKKENQGGLTQMECELTANRATDAPPHIAPLSINAAQVIELQLATNGDFTVGSFYDIPSFRVQSFDGEIRIDGSAPQRVTIKGISNGDYTTPSAHD